MQTTAYAVYELQAVTVTATVKVNVTVTTAQQSTGNRAASMSDTQLLPVDQTKAATHIFGIGAKGQHNGAGGNIPHHSMHGVVLILGAIVQPLPAQSHRVDGYEVVRAIEDASACLATGHQIVFGCQRNGCRHIESESYRRTLILVDQLKVGLISA